MSSLDSEEDVMIALALAHQKKKIPNNASYYSFQNI